MRRAIQSRHLGRFAVLLALTATAAAAEEAHDDTQRLSAILLPIAGEAQAPRLAVNWRGEAVAQLDASHLPPDRPATMLVRDHALEPGMNLLSLALEPDAEGWLWLEVRGGTGALLASRRLDLGAAPGGGKGLGWGSDFFGPGLSSVAYSSTVWDDGTGPALYVGGAFVTVGGEVVNRIARWDGSHWAALGSGLNGIAEALTVYDGELVAAGSFSEAGGSTVNGIARWNGSEWLPLGTGVGGTSSPIVFSLAVYDGELIAGGNFLEAGGVPVNRIARWDGSTWAPLGTGVDNRVLALTVFDGQLVAAGAFNTAGGVGVNRVARWDGTQWAPLAGPAGVGVDAVVMALEVFDEAVIAAGVFTQAGGVDASMIARWDGEAWSALGPGLTGSGTVIVESLSVFDGALVAGGSFTHSGTEPMNRIARWDGTAWAPLGEGFDGILPTTLPSVFTMTAFDGRLIAGGNFTDAGGQTVNRIAHWDGTAWAPLAGISGDTGLNRVSLALTQFGGDFIVGGDFSHAGGQAVRHLARWDGGQWHPMGTGLIGPSSGVAARSFAVFEGDLIVGGHFSHIDGVLVNHVARWDGSQWSALGGGMNTDCCPGGVSVNALAVFEGDLFAAGHFAEAGGVAVNHIARWDGSQWSPLAGGVTHQFTAAVVDALTVLDDGLIAGGTFLAAGGVTVNNVARWDGGEWAALSGPTGAGVNASVTALTTYGGALVAGGSFTTAGGSAAARIALWDGSEWAPLGEGTSAIVRALTVFGGDLIAGGGFREAGGQTVEFLARWDGDSWSPLTGLAGTVGVDNTVFALATLDGDGPGAAEVLAIGGAFTLTGGEVNWGVALYGPLGLEVAPEPLDFGEVPVGETGGPRSLTLTNVGTATVTVSDVDGPEAPFESAAGTCGDPPITLPAAESCTLDFTFSPTTAGPAAGVVTLTSDAPSSPDTVTLLGTGLASGAPELAFEPASLDLGEVEVGSTGPAQIAMLENTGTADATGLDFSDPGSGFHADVGACGDLLPAGESCPVAVTFTPAKPGPSAATLVVTSAQDAAASLSLSGHGLIDGTAFEPVALEVDFEPLISDGNDVFEPGESVLVAPAWRNDGTEKVLLEGDPVGFTGPPGASYTIDFGSAQYGQVEPGATASCRDSGICYELSVDDPVERPATLWVAALDETLSEGPTHTWNLHIGDSFADVPRTSPFYRSIETLLHHEVSGGCSDGEYCPVAISTRGQMPVFVLRALAGVEYTPPACVAGEETFADVPASSGLCPWIDELVRREVVAGCGVSTYCPDAAVNRQQMAVILLRTLEGPSYTPPACEGRFTDVSCPSPFAAWVEELARREITGGCTATEYCPTAAVNRQQMAVFVTETFELRLYGP